MSDEMVTIVTGASSNHFRCLQNLLYSISVHEPGARVIVYDLGLTPDEVAALRATGRQVRKFDDRPYPRHVKRIRTYAWKPIIVADALAEFGGLLLWLDAGNLIHASLGRVRNELARTGFYAPTSGDVVGRWTHHRTLEHLEALPPDDLVFMQRGATALSRCVHWLFGNRTAPYSEFLQRRNRNAAMVGFNAAHAGARELAERWKAGALDKNCIAPRGATLKNHRFDQAVLTVLAYQFAERHGATLEDERLDISTHNDLLSLEAVREKIVAPCMTNC